MSTTADIISNLPRPAKGMSSSDVVRHFNFDVKEDLRDLIYSTWRDTYIGEQIININLITAPTAALSSVAGSVDNGQYRYKISYTLPTGETRVGEASDVITVSDNTTAGQISLTGIPVDSDDYATERNIYRQQNGEGDYELVATISDNTTTTYTDNIAQSALGAIAPQGWTLASDCYDVFEVGVGDIELDIRKRSSGSNYPDKRYVWVDYSDNPDGTSKQVLSIPDEFAFTGEVLVRYLKDIDDITDGGDLPFPASLHAKLLPVVTLGCAFYHLSELSGEDEFIDRIGARYEVAMANTFNGYIGG